MEIRFANLRICLEGVDSIRWFKLLLLCKENMPPDIPPNDSIITTKRLLEENSKKAVDCIADYLRALWCYTIETRSPLDISHVVLHEEGYTEPDMVAEL